MGGRGSKQTISTEWSTDLVVESGNIERSSNYFLTFRESLASGGFGEVWSGTLQHGDAEPEEVAIKVVLRKGRTDNAQFRANEAAEVRRERLTYKTLNPRTQGPDVEYSPDKMFPLRLNRLRIRNPPEFTGRTVLVMEKLSPFSVEFPSRQYIVNPHRIASYGAQLARCVQKMHDRGVLHLDLKFGNTMVREAPDSVDGFQVIVIDFGLCKFIEEVHRERLGSNGKIHGTTAVCSPRLLDENHIFSIQDDHFSFIYLMLRQILRLEYDEIFAYSTVPKGDDRQEYLRRKRQVFEECCQKKLEMRGRTLMMAACRAMECYFTEEFKIAGMTREGNAEHYATLEGVVNSYTAVIKVLVDLLEVVFEARTDADRESFLEQAAVELDQVARNTKDRCDQFVRTWSVDECSNLVMSFARRLSYNVDQSLLTYDFTSQPTFSAPSSLPGLISEGITDVESKEE